MEIMFFRSQILFIPSKKHQYFEFLVDLYTITFFMLNYDWSIFLSRVELFFCSQKRIYIEDGVRTKIIRDAMQLTMSEPFPTFPWKDVLSISSSRSSSVSSSTNISSNVVLILFSGDGAVWERNTNFPRGRFVVCGTCRHRIIYNRTLWSHLDNLNEQLETTQLTRLFLLLSPNENIYIDVLFFETPQLLLYILCTWGSGYWNVSRGAQGVCEFQNFIWKISMDGCSQGDQAIFGLLLFPINFFWPLQKCTKLLWWCMMVTGMCLGVH